MKTLYQANDGTIFETIMECEKYEALPKRKDYEVTFEVRGSVVVYVDAFSEEEAKRIANEHWDETDIFLEDVVSCTAIELK